jgi:predicted AAA-ATPase/PD-(D/E)XK nuclease superfamily protein
MILGVSKVAQSGFLSGLNNLTVCSMKDAKYQPFFGFVESEVKMLLSDKLDKMKRVKKLYNGYTVPFRIGKTKEIPVSLFNPWSIACYKVSNKLESFWMNTSATLILQDFIQRTMNFPAFNNLILKNPIIKDTNLQHDMSYTNIKTANLSEIITFMFNAGFLTQDKKFKSLRIPNEEIRGATLSMLKDIIFPPGVDMDKPYTYFHEDKVGDFGCFLMEVMFQGFSSFDFPKDVSEITYHVMMLALWHPRSQGEYKISSNPNCGRGRCDLMIHPFDTRKPLVPAVLFEFKKATGDFSTTESKRSNLKSSAEKALKQIDVKLYSYGVPGYCDFMYEVGMSFYQRDFYFLWNKRERVGKKRKLASNKKEHVSKKQKHADGDQEHVDDDQERVGDELNIWSKPLETKSGFFCSLDATLYSERALVIRE